MREGWTYKKLGEVALIIGGSTPKTNVKEYWDGENLWVTPAELDGSKYICKTQRCITNLAVEKTNLTLLPIGTVLLSSRAPIGKVCITQKPMYCNQGFKNIVCKDNLFNEFVYYYLKNNIDYLQSLGTGATFKEISKKVVEKIEIPVPPLSEQQRIVSELDLLSSIIEKKKAQLKEYDQLAQSIFYDMFGDPVENPKGWEVKKLGDVCTLKAGKAIKASELKDKADNLFPCYGGNGIRGYIDKISHETDLPIIGRQGALCGNVNYAIAPFYATEHAVVVSPTIELESKWLYYVLKYLRLEQYAHGVAQPGIAVNDLNPIFLPLPPLPLQQSFASKIEAIERQKALIQQSITETETLFNSRMDYYFD